MSSGKSVCPRCGVSLDGGPIPEEINQPYTCDGELRYPYGSKDARWKREIGMEYPDKYDGVWEWMCPDCEHKWPSVIALLKG